MHLVFGYKTAYGRMVEVQARMLAAHVGGELPKCGVDAAARLEVKSAISS